MFVQKASKTELYDLIGRVDALKKDIERKLSSQPELSKLAAHLKTIRTNLSTLSDLHSALLLSVNHHTVSLSFHLLLFSFLFSSLPSSLSLFLPSLSPVPLPSLSLFLPFLLPSPLFLCLPSPLFLSLPSPSFLSLYFPLLPCSSPFLFSLFPLLPLVVFFLWPISPSFPLSSNFLLSLLPPSLSPSPPSLLFLPYCPPFSCFNIPLPIYFLVPCLPFSFILCFGLVFCSFPLPLPLSIAFSLFNYLLRRTV